MIIKSLLFQILPLLFVHRNKFYNKTEVQQEFTLDVTKCHPLSQGKKNSIPLQPKPIKKNSKGSTLCFKYNSYLLTTEILNQIPEKYLRQSIMAYSVKIFLFPKTYVRNTLYIQPHTQTSLVNQISIKASTNSSPGEINSKQKSYNISVLPATLRQKCIYNIASN